MIKFTQLSIQNFLSYGAVPTVIPLSNPGTTLILGENLDNVINGTGANGTGKTVVINALSYGVYDKPVSNISKDNLVNNINKKHMEVIVEFEKGGNTYKIRRVRKAKSHAAGNFVELFENDIDITPDSVANTNKLIETIIGLPHELFVRIVVFSATHAPFLDLPVRSQTGPNQTDIIEELFDLKTLSEKASKLQEQRKELEFTLKSKKDQVQVLEQERERHNKQLESAKQRVINWDKTNKQEVKQLKAKLNQIQSVDVEKQQALHKELTNVEQTLAEATRKLTEVAKEHAKTSKELKKAESELAHLVDEKCPYCLQQYSDGKTKISKTKSTIKANTKLTTQLEADENRLYEIVTTLKKERDTIKKQVTVSNIDELSEIKNKSTDYERRIAELNEAVNPYIEPLQELEEVLLDPINYEDINAITERVEHMKFLYKLLTKKDSFVRKVLLNKNLPFLNKRLQDYLAKLGLTHHVEFTHEMTANITQFGREMDFGNLSNGQRARVNLALSFAFRDVLQNLHGQINICMLDEVLDIGLDGPGVSAAARMLKRKARDENLSLYIITHRDEIDSAFDRVMTIQLKDGFSTILKEKEVLKPTKTVVSYNTVDNTKK